MWRINWKLLNTEVISPKKKTLTIDIQDEEDSEEYEEIPDVPKDVYLKAVQEYVAEKARIHSRVLNSMGLEQGGNSDELCLENPGVHSTFKPSTKNIGKKQECNFLSDQDNQAGCHNSPPLQFAQPNKAE
ncbi:unnamed protein product [Moneuplotes crassus]|uniref:Uncharacterized protein n=1 Tax=Euplotes crassus TaxID=5936 RepID=A0AAD1XRU5_EUPCR|nr:unnamed protein product [Moneuplotes crassus]